MNNDKMILGENCEFSTDCEKTGLNNNVIVCGSSGCGKTMSISEPRLIETVNGSLVTTVTKKRIVKKYRPVFAERGYKVWDLDFVNPQGGNVGYDPLKFVKSYQDITFLAKSVVEASYDENSRSIDPYWNEAASSLLSAEIAYTLMRKEDATFADVLGMHDGLKLEYQGSMLKTNYDEIFDKLEQAAPDCFAVSCWKTFQKLPTRTAGCVFSTLNTTLDTIFSPEIRTLMRMESSIDFGALASEKTVVFVTTSPVNPALNSFINMFYGQVFKQLFEFAEKQPDGTLPIPVHVLCDDFATGGRILNFAEYISIFREKKVSVTLLLQSESQLEAMYGEKNAKTIINNCDSYVYMGGMDINTARDVSYRLNVPLDEVLYMPIGQEFLFRRGQRPIVTNRYDIKKNELYQKITKQYEDSLSEIDI